MQSFTLIDTSSWIEALRVSGNTKVQNKVKKLLTEGRAAWCEMILLELWNGAQGEPERKMLNDLTDEITMLPITDKVWSLANKLAKKCREQGKTIPATDILIVSCGLVHEAEIEHQDKHFDMIREIHNE
jgi:predicted nucleic acid-binding protein